tara:strand:+ start:2111 stop:2359 length:249 start_codon:yes stop_codon:yes gene_type:complete
MIFTVPLNDVNQTIEYINGLFEISCFGKVIQIVVPKYGSDVILENSFSMDFKTDNKELVKRLIKAFKQLAYLNIQEQENSKF